MRIQLACSRYYLPTVLYWTLWYHLPNIHSTNFHLLKTIINFFQPGGAWTPMSSQSEQHDHCHKKVKCTQIRVSLKSLLLDAKSYQRYPRTLLEDFENIESTDRNFCPAQVQVLIMPHTFIHRIHNSTISSYRTFDFSSTASRITNTTVKIGKPMDAVNFLTTHRLTW